MTPTRCYVLIKKVAEQAGLNWRPGRVYFLTLLEPLMGTTGLWPLPPGRPASAKVGGPGTEVD